MNKYRLSLKKNGSNLLPNKNLNGCLEHLDIAYKHLEKHLKGKNYSGLLTNISNASYEIKQNLKK
jgi:hypothetical protein